MTATELPEQDRARRAVLPSSLLAQALANVKIHVAAAEAMGAMTMDIRPPNTGPMIADLRTLIDAIEQDRARPAPGEEELMRLIDDAMAKAWLDGREDNSDYSSATLSAHATFRAALRQALRPVPGEDELMRLARAMRDGKPEQWADDESMMLSAIRQALRQPELAIEQFNKFGAGEETEPLERLRAFCSFAMRGQDWLDVEPFFDDVEKALRQPAVSVPASEPVLMATCPLYGGRWGQASEEEHEGKRVAGFTYRWFYSAPPALSVPVAYHDRVTQSDLDQCRKAIEALQRADETLQAHPPGALLFATSVKQGSTVALGSVEASIDCARFKLVGDPLFDVVIAGRWRVVLTISHEAGVTKVQAFREEGT